MLLCSTDIHIALGCPIFHSQYVHVHDPFLDETRTLYLGISKIKVDGLGMSYV